jgi:hypothetical protein
LSNTPTSFRFPFQLPEDTHPEIAKAIRYTFSGLKDLNDAVVKLVPMVQAGGTNTTITTTNTVNTGGGGSTPATLGNVNLQPNPPTDTSYTPQTSDFGGLIAVTSAVPFEIDLNSGLVAPYYTFVMNFGAGTINFVPSTGSIIGNPNLLTQQFCAVFFDGINWEVMAPLLAQSDPNTASNWLDSYDATTGLFTKSQPSASDLTNGVNGSGRVVLDSGAVVTNLSVLGMLSLNPVDVFANNAAAIAGGLSPGDFYRLGGDPDLLAVVH